MKKTLWLILLAISLIPALTGCGNISGSGGEPVETEAQILETLPPATIPQDGNPDDVTCKGSYTGTPKAGSVAAVMGETPLTNGQLSVWYWAKVAEYRQGCHDIQPDYDSPLDTQACPIDDSVNSWQQYFLQQALDAWHTALALEQMGQEDGAPVDETYKPKQENHEEYMTGMPALSVLYGYNKPYRHNTLHQEFLDGIPSLTQTLAEEKGYSDSKALAEAEFGATIADLEEVIRLYNSGYMYYTTLSYGISSTEEEIEQQFAAGEAAYAEQGITRGSGYTVDLQHILLIPDAESAEGTVTVSGDGTVTCSDAHWEACRKEAEDLLVYWQKKTKHHRGAFADLAYQNSQDTGTAKNGGSYRSIQKGQLIPELDSWAFDPERLEGDTVILQTKYGVHLLYFAGKTDLWYQAAKEDAVSAKAAGIIAAARERFPVTVHYEDILLAECDGTLSLEEVLYPDIAHERFPEVPLYLQQDYPGVKYGAFELRTHGCGITTMAMLASYLSDEEWTPPEMCEKYSNYSFKTGTDGMIFIYEPPVLGFYLIQKTYDPPTAKAALEDGYIVLSLQHKGHWTRGGHYLLLEHIDENGLIQVRDSNIYNYGRLRDHKVDRHTWGCITANGAGFWIFDYKITRIPACSRCGNYEETNAPVNNAYICEKCSPAIQRRTFWLEACCG